MKDNGKGRARFTPISFVNLAGWPLALKLECESSSDSNIRSRTIIPEIEAQVPGVASIIMPLGNGKMLRAAAQYRQKHHRSWKIIAVEPEFYEPSWLRLIPGPRIDTASVEIQQAPCHLVGRIRVSDASTVLASRWLLRMGYFLGASSCAVLAAASYLINKQRLPLGIAVLVMTDQGDQYRSTLYNDDWLLKRGFSITTP